MKKILSVVPTLFIIFIMLGCNSQAFSILSTSNYQSTELFTEQPLTELITTEELLSQTVISEEPTTILPTTEVQSTDIPTTNDTEDEAFIEIVFERLEPSLPKEFSTHIELPTIIGEGLTIEYYQNDILLEDRHLTYIPNSQSQELIIEIKITYNQSTKFFYHNILQLRDESLYQETLIENTFSDVFLTISDSIPDAITSDLSLPIITREGVELSYSVDVSKIKNNRLVFTFPENDVLVHLTISMSFMQEQRQIEIPIVMKAYDQLPRIPEIHIVTDNQSPIDSKDTMVNASLSLYDFDEFNQQIPIIENAGLQIRLRGNSTLFMPKKSYKIKFDVKQYFLSDYKEYDWVLLANFADQTLLRNGLAYQMANDLEMEFAPMVQYVDVYINGEYQGNYLLTDQVEITNDRLNIDEKNTEINTGYLIEFDKRLYDVGLEASEENFFTIDGIPFVIKSPDIKDDHYSHEHYLYIENYMRQVFDTLKDMEDCHHLIDQDSFIDWFIVNELFKNVDSGYSSVFYYKDVDGLLKMGPVWDFDLSSGNYGHLQEDLRGPEGWYTSRQEKNILFHYLMQYDAFRQALKERWNDVYEEVIMKTIDSIYPLADSISKSRFDNFNLWQIIGQYQDWFIAPEILERDSYFDQVEFLRDFLYARAEWLNEAINDF
jgi:hypothetical protein